MKDYGSRFVWNEATQRYDRVPLPAPRPKHPLLTAVLVGLVAGYTARHPQVAARLVRGVVVLWLGLAIVAGLVLLLF